MGKRENRRFPRREANYPVWVRYGADKILVPCTLKDISDQGARLHMPGNGDVPDQFLLFLSESGRAHRRCQVAWRVADQIGVKFLTDED